MQLPKTTEGFVARRATSGLRSTRRILQELTTFLPTPATGSLQANGTIKTDNSVARSGADSAKGDLIGYDKAAVNTLSAKISATKKLPATDASAEEAVLRQPQFVGCRRR